MKIAIIVAAILIVSAGAWTSYQNRQLYIQAALVSEAYNISADAKARVEDYYDEYNSFPQDNQQAQLPPPHTIFGTSVKRVSVVRDGVILVDFNEEMGSNSLQLVPKPDLNTSTMVWTCYSDSIDKNILDKLLPTCIFTPATDESELNKAIANQDIVRTSELLQVKVDLELLINGNTPMMLAARIGNLDIVNLLLEAGANVDHVAANSERRTPLMVAIASNRADVASLLLSQGGSVIRKDYSGRSALDYARETDTRNGDQQFELMLSAAFTPYFGTQAKGDIDELSPAMRQKFFNDLYEQFEFAADSCHVKRAQTLLKENQDNVHPGTDAFLVGLIGDQACPDKLRNFLHQQQAWRVAYRSTLELQVQRCNVKEAAKLMKKHIKTRLDDLYKAEKRPVESFTLQAVKVGCADLLSIFKRPGMDSEVRDDLVVQAIRHTPQSRLLRTVSVLLESGAAVNVADRDGTMPLSAAISFEQPVVAKYLVDAGANVNTVSSNGSFPLIDATMKGYYHLVGHLLNHGADVNQADSMGRTALHAAVAKGRQRTVDVLLKAGADRRLRDENGMDAVVMAESRRHYTIHAMLLE